MYTNNKWTRIYNSKNRIKDYKLPLEELQEASRNIRAGMELSKMEKTTDEFGFCSSLNICSLELPFTAILAVALHTLCFSKAAENGFIVHQGSVRKLSRSDGTAKQGVGEAVDVYGFTMEGGPGWPFFGSEGKTESLAAALKGIAVYTNVCSQLTDDRTDNIGLLGLAATCNLSTLALYFSDGDHSRMQMLNIVGYMTWGYWQLYVLVLGIYAKAHYTGKAIYFTQNPSRM